MSRRISWVAVLMMALMVLFTVSCEGPAGADGADGMDGANGAAGADGADGAAGVDGVDGVDGADGNITCLGCHSSATLADNQFELARSQHGIGAFVGYAGGRSSCAQCHSHEGFQEWTTNGTVSGNYLTPSAWECSTCHGLHSTFTEDFTGADAALRTTAAVTMMFDGATVADVDPGSNLCINCHQSRRAASGYDDGTGTTVNVTSSHAGPHHGPQSNLLLGNNGIEVGTPFAAHVGAGCTGCHMKETTGDDLDVAGGHTFWPTVEACQVCHTSATDFDIFSGQSTVAAKLENLGGLLETAGILHYVVDEETGDSSRHLVTGEYDRAVFQGFWNWDIVTEDRSLGVHNPVYAKALLDASITALGGTP